jgi:hypothetical protein
VNLGALDVETASLLMIVGHCCGLGVGTTQRYQGDFRPDRPPPRPLFGIRSMHFVPKRDIHRIDVSAFKAAGILFIATSLLRSILGGIEQPGIARYESTLRTLPELSSKLLLLYTLASALTRLEHDVYLLEVLGIGAIHQGSQVLEPCLGRLRVNVPPPGLSSRLENE